MIRMNYLAFSKPFSSPYFYSMCVEFGETIILSKGAALNIGTPVAQHIITTLLFRKGSS
jgi:hypothetical protein